MTDVTTDKRTVISYVWAREHNEHYVEPPWCSQRLFETVEFNGSIEDPCCGFGRIPEAAKDAGHKVSWGDVIDRGYPGTAVANFLETTYPRFNIVTNPPFKNFKDFALHALSVTTRKVAMIWGVSRLPAAHWLRDTPLRHVLLLTPRPSMPPGHVLAAGGLAQGGKTDHCWLIWDKSYHGRAPEMRWLHRDGS